MKTIVDENLETFSIYICVFKIFGILELKSSESNCKKFFSFFHSLFFYIFYMICFKGGLIYLKLFTDPIVYFCQVVNHVCSLSCISVIYFNEILSHDFHFEIFQYLSKIDELLIERFSIKIKYKKIKYFNIFVTIILVLMLSVTYMLSPGKNDNLPAILYDFYLVVPYMIWFVEFYFILFVHQLKNRFILIKEIIFSKNLLHHEKCVINEILKTSLNLINTINKLFGLIILSVFGN